MQLEIIREIARALNDTEDGVVAQLAALPKDTGDTVTSDIVVVDATSDDSLAKGEQTTRGNATILVLVTPDGPTGTSHKHTKSEYAYGSTPVAITVAHRGNRQPRQKVADVEYVLRAIVLTLKAYFAQDQAGRIRNQVKLLQTTSLSYGLVEDDGLGALGAVVFNIDTLDMRAQRTV